MFSSSDYSAPNAPNAPTVTLRNKFEFDRLAPEINEQSLTPRGRCQFPEPKFEIGGLDPKMEYTMSLKFKVVSDRCCRYIKKQWRVVPTESSETPDEIFHHTNGPMFGYEWMKEGAVNFEVRLANKSGDEEIDSERKNVVYLRSMCKYSTSLLITPVQRDAHGQATPIGEPKEFAFEELDFITVTKYKNPKIIQYKRENNRFSSALAKKRKHSQSEGLEEEEEREKSPPPKCSKLSSPDAPLTPPTNYHTDVQVDSCLAYNYPYSFNPNYFSLPQYNYLTPPPYLYYSDPIFNSFSFNF